LNPDPLSRLAGDIKRDAAFQVESCAPKNQVPVPLRHDAGGIEDRWRFGRSAIKSTEPLVCWDPCGAPAMSQ